MNKKKYLNTLQMHNLLQNFQALADPWALQPFKNWHRQVRQKPKREFIQRSRLLKNSTRPVGRWGKTAVGAQRQTWAKRGPAGQVMKNKKLLHKLLSTPHIPWYTTSNYENEAARVESFNHCVPGVWLRTVTGSDSDWDGGTDRLRSTNNKRRRENTSSDSGRHIDSPHLRL